MEIKKTLNYTKSNCYDIELIKEGKTLRIFFAGNLDLYMKLSNNQIIRNDENTALFFDITKENYEIYSIFASLYNDIINANPFGNNISIKGNHPYENYKERYEYKILVDENLNINWISDDGPSESEDMIKIAYLDSDTYRLTFIRNDIPLDFGFKNPYGICVRFRNSGSKYDPFNCVFMRMYHELQKIEPDYHQLHFEELVYTRKLKK